MRAGGLPHAVLLGLVGVAGLAALFINISEEDPCEWDSYVVSLVQRASAEIMSLPALLVMADIIFNSTYKKALGLSFTIICFVCCAGCGTVQLLEWLQATDEECHLAQKFYTNAIIVGLLVVDFMIHSIQRAVCKKDNNELPNA